MSEEEDTNTNSLSKSDDPAPLLSTSETANQVSSKSNKRPFSSLEEDMNTNSFSKSDDPAPFLSTSETANQVLVPSEHQKQPASSLGENQQNNSTSTVNGRPSKRRIVMTDRSLVVIPSPPKKWKPSKQFREKWGRKKPEELARNLFIAGPGYWEVYPRNRPEDRAEPHDTPNEQTGTTALLPEGSNQTSTTLSTKPSVNDGRDNEQTSTSTFLLEGSNQTSTTVSTKPSVAGVSGVVTMKEQTKKSRCGDDDVWPPGQKILPKKSVTDGGAMKMKEQTITSAYEDVSEELKVSPKESVTDGGAVTMKEQTNASAYEDVSEELKVSTLSRKLSVSSSHAAKTAHLTLTKTSTNNVGDTDYSPIALILGATELWAHKILPFIGPGHFLFVAGVNKRMKQLWGEYFSSIPRDMIPKLLNDRGQRTLASTPMIFSNTSLLVAFSSASFAHYWNQTRSGPVPANLLRVVARAGNRRVLLWAIDRFLVDFESETTLNMRCVTVGAAQGGHVELLEWARANNFSFSIPACYHAAREGHLQALQWLHAIGCPLVKSTCAAPAEGGHLELLKWVHANGCPWDEDACLKAARNGHLEVLQWLRANGCPWNQTTCNAAAGAGRLEVLEWATANGCRVGPTTCVCAAIRGHLEVLQWLHSNGCPWTEDTCRRAAQNGHLEVLRWARSNGCPCPEDLMGLIGKICSETCFVRLWVATRLVQLKYTADDVYNTRHWGIYQVSRTLA